MHEPLDEKTLRRTLRASVVDGSGYSAMVGLGETYLPAFALALGHGDIRAGLTATVPMLAGAALQLATPSLVRRMGSHRRWTVLVVALQALCFVPLMLAAHSGRLPWVGVVLLATWYWSMGLSAAPTWNAWISRVVPPEIRARFFGIRTPVTQVFMFAGLLAGGAILHHAERGGYALRGFAWIFAAACFARAISSVFLWIQAEVSESADLDRAISPVMLLRPAQSAESKLIVYMLIVQATTQIGIPFLTPYMLHDLRLSYDRYVYLLAAGYLGRVVSQPLFGRWAHRHGTRHLMWIGGIAIAPVGLLWLPYPGWPYLLFVQFVTGVAFAAYELATLLLLIESLPQHLRTSIMTTYNFLNALATVGGSLAGGAILRAAGEDHRAYLLVFGVSTLMRLASWPLLRTVIDRPLWRGN